MLKALIIGILQIPLLFMPPLQIDTSYADIKSHACTIKGCATGYEPQIQEEMLNDSKR